MKDVMRHPWTAFRPLVLSPASPGWVFNPNSLLTHSTTHYVLPGIFFSQLILMIMTTNDQPPVLNPHGPRASRHPPPFVVFRTEAYMPLTLPSVP